jgi:hypothetical protein
MPARGADGEAHFLAPETSLACMADAPRCAQMSSTSASATPTPSPTLSSTVHRGSRSPPAAPPTLTITPPSAGGAGSGDLEEKTGGLDRPSNRRRSSSIVHVEKIQMSPVELLDQSAGFNANAEWVNYKGAWVIHVVLIVVGKILLDVVPGMEQDTSWTCVNLSYIAVSVHRATLVQRRHAQKDSLRAPVACGILGTGMGC